tara:strand:- start:3466 stop:4590 length:1125 start_codon:yes stop_codon:yes gene_type:complete
MLLKEKIVSFISNSCESSILEPCFGRGDLVEFVKEKKPEVSFDLYEIDSSLPFLDCIKDESNSVEYCDFLSRKIEKFYETIIGNPPYEKTKKGNLYIDFIEKCVNLLEPNGELIFIVPSDFLKLTSSRDVLNSMMLRGTFTHIFHPHKENLFKNATIDIIVFRYCKNSTLEKKVLYNDIPLHIVNSEGLITFSSELSSNIGKTKFEDLFNIYVGLVSGREKIFKNDTFGNITVQNSKERFDKYIYIKEYPTSQEDLNTYLEENKEKLISRQIRKFNKHNWFEWGALRNIKVMEVHKDKECIYITNITRKEEVAFKGKVGYFGGGLLMLLPKTDCNLDTIVTFLNTPTFKKNFTYSGRFRIGQSQLAKSYINNPN